MSEPITAVKSAVDRTETSVALAVKLITDQSVAIVAYRAALNESAQRLVAVTAVLEGVVAENEGQLAVEEPADVPAGPVEP